MYEAAGTDDCIDVLVNRRASLLMCSDDGSLLDRHAQTLLRNLRDVADVETAVLLEMDRGLLLDRFNRLLTEFTIEQARQRVPTSSRVWILHVHSAAELGQARLLLRLCQDFPAAGVVLAMLGPIAVGRELAPDGSGRRLQVRVLTDFWSEMSRAAGPQERADPPLGPPQDLAPAPAAPAPAPAAASERRPVVQRAPWIGLALLLASAAVVIWAQSRAGLDTLDAAPPGPRGAATLSSAGPVVSAPDPSAQVDAPSVPSPDTLTAPVAQAATVAAIPLPSATPAQPTAAPAAELPQGAVPASVAATADRPVALAGNTLPPSTTARPAAPGDQIASTARWVQAQPPSGWLVQHGIDNDVGRLLDMRSRFPGLGEARVLALLRADGRLYYALVSGPFESAGDARGFIKDGSDLPSLPWVRSIASLARELEDRRVRAPAAD